MPDDRCACGAPAQMYLASGVRCCLAHVPRDAPAIRSDVSVDVRCRHCGVGMTVISPPRCVCGASLLAAEPARVWRQRVRMLLHREIDTRQRMAEAVQRANAAADILRRHGDIGARAALRALEGEP